MHKPKNQSIPKTKQPRLPYQRISPEAYRKQYDPQGVFVMSAKLGLTAKEHYFIASLIALRTAFPKMAVNRRKLREFNRYYSTDNLMLNRLVAAKIIINLGTEKVLDLAVQTDYLQWDIRTLNRMRKEIVRKKKEVRNCVKEDGADGAKVIPLPLPDKKR